MKIACIIPHSYEKYFIKEISEMESPDDLDKNFLCRVDSCEQKICKSLSCAGFQPTFFYLSAISSQVSQFRHKYGHLMKKIPVNLKIGKYGIYGYEFSYRLFRELSRDSNELALIFTYTMGNVIPIDMYDLLALYFHRKGKPFVARHGGGSSNPYFRGIPILYKKWIKQKTLNFANLIVVPSSSEAFIVEKKLGIDPGKILILKDPLDFDNICESSKESAALNLNKDACLKYILYVGRLSESKGIRHIINCMRDLIREHSDIVLLLVGTGPDEGVFRQIVHEKGLDDYVSFEGFVFHEKLGDYYNLADVLVLPSYSEGTPNVIQEAVAFNLPCVGTSVGGIPDILSEGVGILVTPKDEKGLYCGVKKILDGNFEINQSKRMKFLDEWKMEYYGKKIKEVLEKECSFKV